MRVKLVGKGSINGLKNRSDIQVLIVPDNNDDPRKENPDHIPISVAIDPESEPGDPELILYVDE